jgi:hypothetical protein
MPLASDAFSVCSTNDQPFGDSVDCGDTSVVSSTMIVIGVFLCYYSMKYNDGKKTLRFVRFKLHVTEKSQTSFLTEETAPSIVT